MFTNQSVGGIEASVLRWEAAGKACLKDPFCRPTGLVRVGHLPLVLLVKDTGAGVERVCCCMSPLVKNTEKDDRLVVANWLCCIPPPLKSMAKDILMKSWRKKRVGLGPGVDLRGALVRMGEEELSDVQSGFMELKSPSEPDSASSTSSYTFEIDPWPDWNQIRNMLVDTQHTGDYLLYFCHQISKSPMFEARRAVARLSSSTRRSGRSRHGGMGGNLPVDLPLTTFAIEDLVVSLLCASSGRPLSTATSGKELDRSRKPLRASEGAVVVNGPSGQASQFQGTAATGGRYGPQRLENKSDDWEMDKLKLSRPLHVFYVYSMTDRVYPRIWRGLVSRDKKHPGIIFSALRDCERGSP
ncbi:hypothetical protein P154DRAFT_533546 [Amniculicola lignicola CBS 123094]|uniref:Uncharacterized protein n=1 Tax=Amniculicola lignicola CBS 123094 TaxID=1392246 RepID=A0A6A5WJ80_9PLEO|nr:hypothetical protein P154DRAFT_533546 [Amniculicola lignicola CBS 123094]